jgi:transposase
MEACSEAHFIAHQLAALGHDVRLIPAQYVKPFLKGHKNDYVMPRRLQKPCSGRHAIAEIIATGFTVGCSASLLLR